MTRITTAVGLLLVSAVLLSVMLTSAPAPVSAGGLPCFMCHGVNFEGSDIAPRVAGTKLSDEEILKQIRSPRGLMPAFPEFAQPSIVQWIRSAPTGQPTKAFSPQERSAVLATISAVAAARATAVLQAATVSDALAATPSATPRPTASPAASAPPAAPTRGTAASFASSESNAPLGWWAVLGLSLAVAAVVLWQHRRS